MGEKVRTTLYIDSETIKKAQQLGLNVSKTCENALKEAIERLKPLYYKSSHEDCPDDPNNNAIGSPG